MGLTRNNMAASITVNAVLSIYNSLTKNAQKIFELIIKNHLNLIKNPQPGNYLEDNLNLPVGIDLDELYSLSKKAFLVNNLNTLKNQLIEFKDHKLIFSDFHRKSERIILKIELATIEEFKDAVGF